MFYLLPFLISFSFGTGILNDISYSKQFAFGLAFLIMGILILFNKESCLPIEIKINYIDVAIIVLFTIYMIYFAKAKTNLDFFLPILYFLFYIFIRLLPNNITRNSIRIIADIVPFILIGHFALSTLQFINITPSFHPYFAGGSTFGNPDMFGSYIAILLPFCYTRKNHKIIGYILSFICFAFLFLLKSRTAIIASGITIILYLFLSNRLPKNKIKWVLLLSLLGVLLLTYWHPESLSGRFFIWIVCFSMMFAKPLGWGLYGFNKNYLEYQADFIAENPHLSSFFNIDTERSSFNEFLNVGVTLGIPALLIYLTVIVGILILAYKSRSMLILPICSFVVISLAYFPFSISPVVVVFIMVTALLLNSSSPPIFKLKINRRILLLLPLLAITSVITYNMYKYYRYWQVGFKNMRYDNNYELSQIMLDRAYPYYKGNGRFLITYAYLKYQMKDTQASLLIAKDANEIICDAVILKNIAAMYESIGDIITAKDYIDKAVRISNNKYSMVYQQILYLNKLGRHEEGYNKALVLYQDLRSNPNAENFIIRVNLQMLIKSYE